MILFDAPVTPDSLTTFIRSIPIEDDLRLLREAGSETALDNKVDWSIINRRNRTARYRSFDGRIHVSTRDAGEAAEVNLIPMSSSLNRGEYERLQLQFAITGGTRVSALARAIYNDAEQLTREVQNRLELAIGDVLTDGKITINENGFIGEADFGVPTDQIVAPATLWSNTGTATVLTNLKAWVAVMRAKGVRPGAIRTSQRVVEFILANAEIINAAYGNAAGRTYATLPDVNRVFADHGIPPLVEPYDTAVDVDGTETRVIPDDRVLLTPASLSDLVAVVSGVTATALELVNSNVAELSFADSPGIVGVVEKVGPPYREFTFVDAVNLPVLRDAQRLLVADVA